MFVQVVFRNARQPGKLLKYGIALSFTERIALHQCQGVGIGSKSFSLPERSLQISLQFCIQLLVIPGSGSQGG